MIYSMLYFISPFAALAGIKGAKQKAVISTTKSVFLVFSILIFIFYTLKALSNSR